MLKLSIIVPVYNVENYLSKCLDSLIDPKREDYEILLINDGSTDASLSVAERYAARYPALIQVITTENQGQGNARNVGMELSKGEFLYFIDSDDYLAEDGLQGILSCLDNSFDICIFDSIAVNVEGKELKYMKGCDQTGDLNLRDHPQLLLQGPDVWNKIFAAAFLWTMLFVFPPAFGLKTSVPFRKPIITQITSFIYLKHGTAIYSAMILSPTRRRCVGTWKSSRLSMS